MRQVLSNFSFPSAPYGMSRYTYQMRVLIYCCHNRVNQSTAGNTENFSSLFGKAIRGIRLNATHVSPPHPHLCLVETRGKANNLPVKRGNVESSENVKNGKLFPSLYHSQKNFGKWTFFHLSRSYYQKKKFNLSFLCISVESFEL